MFLLFCFLLFIVLNNYFCFCDSINFVWLEFSFRLSAFVYFNLVINLKKHSFNVIPILNEQKLEEKISEIVNDNHLIILDSKLENLQNIINDKMNKDLNFMILEEGEVMENLIEKLKSIQLFNGEFNNGKV